MSHGLQYDYVNSITNINLLEVWITSSNWEIHLQNNATKLYGVYQLHYWLGYTYFQYYFVHVYSKHLIKVPNMYYKSLSLLLCSGTNLCTG